MPRISGIEFMKRCRQLRPEAARIILSGADERDAVPTPINDVSVYTYLTKPGDDSALRNMARETLGGAVKARTEIAAAK